MFGEKLKEMRMVKKCTLEDVANALGVTKQAIYAFEIGRKTPSQATLIALADFLECSTDYLLGRANACK